MRAAIAAADSEDSGLVAVMSLLVDEPAKRDAIIEAYRSNDGLRDQWLRTWELLRSTIPHTAHHDSN